MFQKITREWDEASGEMVSSACDNVERKDSAERVFGATYKQHERPEHVGTASDRAIEDAPGSGTKQLRV